METNVKNRFGGIERLYGQHTFAVFQSSRVAIVGIGGVGSWCAESLARSGIGKLTLIDLDDICVTNINRQVHALGSTVNQGKVDAMKARIQDINPSCEVECIEDFVTPDNASDYIANHFDYVIEATDSVKAKASIIAHCKRNKIAIVTIGGAGGQVDPTQVQACDLAKTIQDPLAAKVRSELRRFYNFSKNPKRRFGVTCIFSTEQLKYPQPDGSISSSKSTMDGSTRLDCASGFGSISTVTTTFAMFAVSIVLNKIHSRI
ncbi:tRNA cyclic N6-threonylcarbamoyladenosine(37) synthase TcdA [Alteromonas sp. 5E99-2]|uniref:tRNA cyclic N6-threonylcarbamoyladenosine(37) synthase TcdA n=1 Tax=Alteromonas sp. 5E99-2 TaxID=2817683 RepID=UPI001A98FEB5|nr:tRNA cyclic N6-threonylcarbamoyladenosine(37) synthase TcdA [Alteromonas sp. 5E99-2]MBO1255508.1 tRNA cyclic N6-threonylcarbamoyladenosine(37) synthase TcdA [Alteromonas sp. 5E99-2]